MTIYEIKDMFNVSENRFIGLIGGLKYGTIISQSLVSIFVFLLLASCKTSYLELLTDGDTKYWKEMNHEFPNYLSFSKLDMKCLEHDRDFQVVYKGLEKSLSRGYFIRIEGNKIIRCLDVYDSIYEEDTLEILSLNKRRMDLVLHAYGNKRNYHYESCKKNDTDREYAVDVNDLRPLYCYILFQNTPIWELAKAVQDCNTKEIVRQVRKCKVSVNAKDPTFGETLLMMAVYDKNPGVVETLLSLGADPNMYEDSINTAGHNAVTLVCDGHGASEKILDILLKNGGNPNSIACCYLSDKTRRTALELASSSGSLKCVKLLVEAGADVNFYDQNEDAIFCSAIHRNMNVLLYLLEHGADCYRKYKWYGIDRDILYFLRMCPFALDSKEYQDKLKVISFLQEKGLNYWETPVNEDVIDEIKLSRIYLPYDINEYLERY